MVSPKRLLQLMVPERSRCGISGKGRDTCRCRRKHLRGGGHAQSRGEAPHCPSSQVRPSVPPVTQGSSSPDPGHAAKNPRVGAVTLPSLLPRQCWSRRPPESPLKASSCRDMSWLLGTVAGRAYGGENRAIRMSLYNQVPPGARALGARPLHRASHYH